MKTHRRARAIALAAANERGTVLWLIAILLAIIATVLVMQAGGMTGVRPAYGDTPMMGGRGIYAFTGAIDNNRSGLFMMDVDNSTVWAYEYLPSTRKLRLVFARSFTFDRYLEDYGLDEQTAPAKISQLLTMQRERKERDARSGAGAADDADGLLTTSLPGMPTTQENTTGAEARSEK